MDRVDQDPRWNFYRDLKLFLGTKTFMTDDKTVIPILLGDWYEECKGMSTLQRLCDDFGLVNLFDRLSQSKTIQNVHEKFSNNRFCVSSTRDS
jgi:hypothetical protein